jgi:hypothetical protein
LIYVPWQLEQKAMKEQIKRESTGPKPPAHFNEPRHVVTDGSLSKDEKAEALDTLEQDARQLAEASSEGMTGGERNRLHDVLIAKDTLALPPD